MKNLKQILDSNENYKGIFWSIIAAIIITPIFFWYVTATMPVLNTDNPYCKQISDFGNDVMQVNDCSVTMAGYAESHINENSAIKVQFDFAGEKSTYWIRIK